VFCLHHWNVPDCVKKKSVSAAQMSYVHMHTTFMFCNFLDNKSSGHSTSVLSAIDKVLIPVLYVQVPVKIQTNWI